MVIFAGKHPEEMGGKKITKISQTSSLHAQVWALTSQEVWLIPGVWAVSWLLHCIFHGTTGFCVWSEPDSYGCSKMKNYNYLASITYNSQSLMEMFKSLRTLIWNHVICFNSDDSSNSFGQHDSYNVLLLHCNLCIMKWHRFMRPPRKSKKQILLHIWALLLIQRIEFFIPTGKEQVCIMFLFSLGMVTELRSI